ncbi:hypothetical protein AB0A76_28360 [Streptomyces exfoliatus]|uniref:Uncharacterized protein n=1 Tax=Streptomyces exfoliatus TaxID=1905 RepID=A0ABV3D4G5_STREX
MYDTTEPERDWESHLDQVAARAVPLPGELAALLRSLPLLLDDEPLAVLRAIGALEAIVADAGPVAARIVTRRDRTDLPRIAEALGMTEQATDARLSHYTSLNL